jgi:hypothetical protein
MENLQNEVAEDLNSWSLRRGSNFIVLTKVLNGRERCIYLTPSPDYKRATNAPDEAYIVRREANTFSIRRFVEEPWVPALGDKVKHSAYGGGFTIVGLKESSIGLIFNPFHTDGHDGARWVLREGGSVPGFPDAHHLVSLYELSLEQEAK